MGIVSKEAFGTADAVRLLDQVGIASGEAFGLTSLTSPQYIDATNSGIGSAETFGTATVSGVAAPVVVTTGGVGGISYAHPVRRRTEPQRPPRPQTVGVPAIASAEQFGAASLQVGLAPIAPLTDDTLAAFRRIGLRKKVPLSGVPGAEALGSPIIRQLLPLYEPPIYATRDEDEELLLLELV